MTDDGAAALEALYWRDEILQAMFWMAGEGLADAATAPDLARFLAADPGVIAAEFARLAAGGYLERIEGSDAGDYRLTEIGRLEGGRSFQDEFDELTRQAHGECAPGCTCQDPRHAGEPCPSLEPARERVRA
jgi:hypothetical protein